jgi:hypothetical protein
MSFMGPLRYYPFIVGGAAMLTLTAAYVARKRRRTPEERERERREHLAEIGRIADGTVLDVHEMEHNGTGSQFLVFQYDVSGVSYEASQDVTYLRHHIDLHSCRIGLPTSVKYDPGNPADSIVVAEGWMGLRK